MFSHMGSKKIPANTPLTFEIEIAQCAENIKNITYAVGKKFKKNKNINKILHSDLKAWTGDPTHDKNGDLRRFGQAIYSD